MKLKLWQMLPLLTTLVGCGSEPVKEEPPPPPPPPPTRIFLKVNATGDINPDHTGRPSPVVLRVYDLKSVDTFMSADFFKLFEQGDATLAGNLIDTKQMVIKPSQVLRLERTPEGEIRYLGFVAAFRDNAAAVWRATVPIPPHQTTTVSVKLEKLSVTVQSDNQPPNQAE